MRPVLLIDFGSTCTKLTAVDLDSRRILGSAQDFTTAQSDISLGLEKAEAKLEQQCGKLSYTARLACSSAAGGLRMVACGLVPELTAKAARLAAFGAGAKVIKTYAYELTADDLNEIAAIAPDILLLVGGTDGGNSEVVINNAKALADIPGSFPIVFAGNRAAKDACTQALANSGHPVHTADNVMPTFGVVQAAPAQQAIRDIFLKRIIHGKGLTRFSAVLDDILMPTPAAVLAALELLSEGVKGQPGLGDLMAIDLGGATTDIYSIASGDPTDSSTHLLGLREPFVKRTVEGDIGMRYSAHGVLEAAGMDEMTRLSGLPEERVLELLQMIEANPSMLPKEEDARALDFALAALSVRLGLVRHAGRIQQVYTPVGPMYQQEGKDLTGVSRIILTGGALIYSNRTEALLNAAVDFNDPGALIPRNFTLTRDTRYVLSAMGLLAGYDKEAAFHILHHIFGKEQNDAAC